MTIVWIFCFIGVGTCVSGLLKLVDWMEGKR
jgi:hypothetical protein|uniref:Uncharacterized protein n=1 Tax=Siphoviridae sp. ctFBb37 TaxID=2827565 RepID=A0A8S5RSS5_9CAUD|nr:MAG TPA: hypothetical protein [Siphoviridae sp. ctFBb37]